MKRITATLLAPLVLTAATPVLASLAGTDVVVPLVGRGTGAAQPRASRGGLGSNGNPNGQGGLGKNSSNDLFGYLGGGTHAVHGANGTLSKSSGSFKIDHPLDPASTHLYHSFVESPGMMRFLNGNLAMDEKGFATLRLPEWFEALNRDFRYQLTVREGGDPWVQAREAAATAVK